MSNRIAKTTVSLADGNELWVSTVRLLFAAGWPIPYEYETIVFLNGDWGGIYQERYETHDEAVAGHERIVAAAQRGEYTNDPDSGEVARG